MPILITVEGKRATGKSYIIQRLEALLRAEDLNFESYDEYGAETGRLGEPFENLRVVIREKNGPGEPR